ncbi:MAG: malonyl-CoA decarboxylase [Burkholderiales bacterium]
MVPATKTLPRLKTLGSAHGWRWWLRRVAGALWAGGRNRIAERASSRLLAPIEELCDDYRAQRGSELSARARSERFVALYRAADLDQRAAILDRVTHAFAPERNTLNAALSAMQSATDDVELSRAEARLRTALDAPRARFLTQFNLLPDGVKFLVDLRADLYKLLPKAPSIEVLKVELDGLLASWFDPGFLELRRISWQSPAFLLEKLIAYERVHPIESWNDLRNRLDTDRRCYAYFHPRMPDEPLIFVEIALLKGTSASVQMLLDEQAPVRDPRTVDTAIFYSISSTQVGLRGISFGNLLLKRVIQDLRHDLPQLKMFATLSPVPGFRRWLDQAVAEGKIALAAADAGKLAHAARTAKDGTTLATALARPDWVQNAALADALRKPMEKLFVRYLLEEKADARPLDSVARFHLDNGARVNRIFWLADASARGMQQSYGMMVSYRYDLGEVEKNHERFLRDGHIAAAARVRRLLG